jgi:hypothetical protein
MVELFFTSLLVLATAAVLAFAALVIVRLYSGQR